MPDQEAPDITLPVAFIDALSHADSTEAVLSAAAQWLPRLMPAIRASLSLADGDRLITQVARTDGHSDADFDSRSLDDAAATGRVMATGAPMFLSIADHLSSGGGTLRRLYESGIRTVLIVPMQSGAQTVGVISIADNGALPYSPTDAQNLMTIGRWIASQARLMQEARNSVRAAETDALTGLANRARLMRVLDRPEALNRRDVDGRVIGVMHIDLDHFKEVNDTLGHAAGDAVLRHVARAMRANVGPSDLVARTGGDEFVIVTRTDPGGRQLAALARRIAPAINRPVQFGDVEARVGSSIGTAIANCGECDADSLLGDADIALYEVKRSGRGGIRPFSRAMRATLTRRQRMITDLTAAVEERAFQPFFQPIVDLQTGYFCGFEMLARWLHPEYGMLEPKDFLPVAAEIGLAHEIDAIVRTRGLSALCELRRGGWQTPMMSFNASAETLRNPSLTEALMRDVAAHGLDPRDLVIEVREDDLLAVGPDRAASSLAALHQAGFSTELDDFGARHAALATIASLPIRAIKMDGSMIARLHDRRGETVVRALVGLARDLDLRVTAEGIETPTQYAALRAIGCAAGQGYGISPPLPLPELMTFIQGYGRSPMALAGMVPVEVDARAARA